MARFVIRLFGVVGIEQEGELLSRFRSNKARALLAYLLIEGRSVPRREIAELLWDGYTMSAALTNLRQVLANLRKVLKPFDVLKSSYQTVQIQLTHPDLWCDFVAMQVLLAADAVPDLHVWPTLAPYLEDEFLHDLTEIDSAPFQAWRAAKRAAVRQQVAQLQQTMNQPASYRRPTVRIVPGREVPDANGARHAWAELSRRLCDPDYPFLSLAEEVQSARNRLAVADAFHISPKRVQQTLHTLSARPPTIQALLFGAWESLDATARTALLRCVVFRGGFTAAAAHAIVNVSAEVLIALAEQGLLERQPAHRRSRMRHNDRRAEIGEVCFQLPKLVRQYAEAQLLPSVVEDLQSRHATYYLELLAAWKPGKVDGIQLRNRLQQEQENLQWAWEWATQRGAIDLLAGALDNCFHLYLSADDYLALVLLLRRTAMRLRQLETADDAPANNAQRLLVPLLRYLGVGHRALGQYDQALQVTQEALMLATQHHDTTTEIACYFELGSVAYFQGDYTQAALLGKKGLALAEQNGLVYWQVRLAALCGLIEQDTQQYQSALALFGQIETLLQQGDTANFHAELLHRLTMVRLRMGDFATAAELLQAFALEVYQWGNYHMAAIATNNRGFLHLLLGDYASAQAALCEAVQFSHDHDDRRVEAVTLSLLAMLHAQKEQPAKAEEYCNRALALAEAGGFQQTIRDVCLTRGHLLLRQRDTAAAQQAYKRALLLSQGNDAPAEEAEAHAYLAVALCAQGDGTAALDHIETVLESFAAVDFRAEQNPQRLLLCCYRVLASLRDERAPGVLVQARELLQTQAFRIGNEDLRHSYLTNVPFNRELVRLGERSSCASL